MLRKLLQTFRSEGLGGEVSRGAAGSFALRVGSTVLSFALSVMFARLLGASGFGTYILALAVIEIFTIPAQSGFQTLVVRQIAASAVESSWGRIRGVLRFSYGGMVALSAMLAAGLAGFLWIFGNSFDPALTRSLSWGLLLLPFLALTFITVAGIQGFRYVVAAQVPLMLIRPGMLILVGLCVWLALHEPIQPWQAVLAHAGVMMAALFYAGMVLHAITPDPARKAQPEYRARAWMVSLMRLILLGGFGILAARVDPLLLGTFANPEDVARFRVSVTVSALVAIPLQILNPVLAPHCSALHARGDRERLQRMATLSVRLALVLALPAMIALAFFGDPFVRFAFGEDFRGTAWAIVIMCIAQFISTALGSVGILLNMSGHEKDTLRGVGLGAMLHILASLVLVPVWGIVGAAVGTSLGLMVWKVFLVVRVRQRIGIDSTALGIAPRSE